MNSVVWLLCSKVICHIRDRIWSLVIIFYPRISLVL